jgi:hypothetical protein
MTGDSLSTVGERGSVHAAFLHEVTSGTHGEIANNK